MYTFSQISILAAVYKRWVTIATTTSKYRISMYVLHRV